MTEEIFDKYVPLITIFRKSKQPGLPNERKRNKSPSLTLIKCEKQIKPIHRNFVWLIFLKIGGLLVAS